MGKSSSPKVRIIEMPEIQQRGCKYCPHYSVGRGKNHAHIHWCAYRKCPYNELDAYETYDDYLKAFVKKEVRYE